MLLSNQTREGLKITGKHNSANLLLNLCSQVYVNLFPSVNSFVEMTISTICARDAICSIREKIPGSLRFSILQAMKSWAGPGNEGILNNFSHSLMSVGSLSCHAQFFLETA